MAVKKAPIQATAPAYKINDRRSSTGYTGAGGGSNRLIDAATQRSDRGYKVLQDRDFHRNVSTLGRRTLMTLGRWMFWNIPALQGMVLEQANLAVGTFIPQFFGANRAWGNKAEEWLYNWHKIGDIAGSPYDFDFFLQTHVVSPIVDGDFGVLLTGTAGADSTDPNGLDYPMWQIIPGHRIGGKYSPDNVVKSGPYDGARIIDGVIVNDYGRPMAYRVFGEDYDPNVFQDVSTRDMYLHFYPMFPGQLRGLSLLASGAFNFQDSLEWDRFEMLAQKVFAAQTIIETNESGDTDSAKALIKTAATFDENDRKLTLDEESMGGGTVRYFKAGTGSKIESFKGGDRPTTATQDFQSRKVRDAFRGTEWDAFFSLDPQSVGGAPMRIIVEKINRVLDKRRRMVSKSCERVDGYALSKAIKNGEIEDEVEWFKWEYQGPGDVTADRKYDSDVDIQEVHARLDTRKAACGRRGKYWEEVDAQTEAEADSDIAAAIRLAGKHKITFEQAMTVLRPPTPNGMPAQAQQPAQDQGKGDNQP